jgi:PilZ domain
MGLTQSTLLIQEQGGTTEAEEDRRSNDRARFINHVRITRQNSSNGEEVGTMIDLSRDGLYFAARSHDYPIGTVLCVNLLSTGAEWLCEVVRTELLPNGSLGVGVRIIR